ncbi:MAG TPA: hypothetical protein VFB12_09370 [Ktedonobacteraceae bacterium]|nr:hypothetical protein [Ktedonobacteraceae bacterium]
MDWDSFDQAYDSFGKQYFEALNTQLQSSGFTCVIIGDGGIGKSQLLFSLCHSYLHSYTYLHPYTFHPSCFHSYWQPVSLSITDSKLAPVFERKWLEQQLQQIGITIPEETGYVDVLIMRRAMQFAKQQEESPKIEIQGVEYSPLPSLQEVLQAYLYSVAIFVLKRCTAKLRRFVIAQRRLQYLAAEIHNRVARSPSPFRREPPVGGIKVGGEFSPSSCLLVA